MVAQIRPASPSDLRAIVSALVSLNHNGTDADPRYRLSEGAEQRLSAHLRGASFGRFLPFPACLVAEDAGGAGLVGLISAEISPVNDLLDWPPSARIDNLWVEPTCRRQGIARRLFEEMTRRSSSAGFSRMTVSTLARDERAIAFWRSVGLRELFVVLAP